MNFTWRETTSADLKLFNDWHRQAKIKNNQYDNISVFLTDTALLGNFIDNITSSFPERLKAITALLNDVPVGVVVAYIRNQPKLDNIVTFEAIAVNPELTGKGIGTAMIFDVVKNSEKIFNYNPKVIRAVVNASNYASKKVFKKNNFEIYNDDGSRGKGFYELKRAISELDKRGDSDLAGFRQQILEVIKLAKLQQNLNNKKR